MIHHMGWKPDRPDHQDHLYAHRNYLREAAPALPKSVDLRDHCSPIHNQGQLGSCTGEAVIADLEFIQNKQQETFTALSPLFVYYNERAMEGTADEDSGAQIRDGIKSVVNLGACPESLWPYDISKFTVKPPKACYTDALNHQALVYQRITTGNLTQMKTCLAAGFAFVFGFCVYESFESDAVSSTGIMPMPKRGEQLLGGHAVMAVGYDDTTSRLLVRNSWGSSWGQDGYFVMPYAFLSKPKLTDDFWTIRKVE
jgi:C1A family cysteine protease